MWALRLYKQRITERREDRHEMETRNLKKI